MDTENFKNILKDLRIEKGVRQNEVAKGCDVSPQCISQLELGTRSPTGSTLIALAEYFNCSVDYLLGRSDEYANRKIESDLFKNGLSSEEKELLKTSRNLPEDLQEHLLRYAKKLEKLYKEQKK
ncbi:MAG: helix-turn-helix domain-containing protein [Clostridia bacterium]|nr:helix-turn-helix domain-containing protein [Clostridia bacterium]